MVDVSPRVPPTQPPGQGQSHTTHSDRLVEYKTNPQGRSYFVASCTCGWLSYWDTRYAADSAKRRHLSLSR